LKINFSCRRSYENGYVPSVSFGEERDRERKKKEDKEKELKKD